MKTTTGFLDCYTDIRAVVKRALAFLKIILLVCFFVAPVQATIITSNFDSGSDGWLSETLSFPNPGSPPLSSGTYSPNWNATGGNPTGYVTLQDPDGSAPTGNTQYWHAPAKFLGNLLAFYGGALTYDVIDAGTFGSFNEADVLLVGSGLTLEYNTSVIPSTSLWTSYAIGLAETGWHIETATGPGAAVTKAQMQAVLSSVSGIYIRGEYRLGPDLASLDNPTLSIPEPSSLLLVALGVVGLGIRRFGQREG